MSFGVTLGTGPILTKIVSQWFVARRGLTLGLVSGAGSFGAMILCLPRPHSWCCYPGGRRIFLAVLLLLLILPIGILLIRDRPEDKVSGLSALATTCLLVPAGAVGEM